jgi:hypothetical protein
VQTPRIVVLPVEVPHIRGDGLDPGHGNVPRVAFQIGLGFFQQLFDEALA